MNQSNIKLAEDHLYDDVAVMKQSGLTPNQVNVVLRIRDAYTMLRDNPSKKEREIVDHLVTIYGIAKSQAYNDLKVVKILIGNFEQASRDWHLWKFNQRNEETRELARKWKNGNAMARCDHDYAKFNKLDQEEVTEIDWDSIRVQPFTVTSDPSVIGIKNVPNILDKINKLEKEYATDLEATDTDYEDVTFNPEDIFKTEKEVEDDKWK
jgi:hypothetical protein